MADYSFKADRRISDWEREILRKFCSSLEGDTVALAREFGLAVHAEELLPYERGYLENAPSYGSPSGWVLKVNRRDSREVQNFTVAHELGHFVLHKAHLAGRDVFDGRINRDSQSALDPFSYLERPDQLMELEANQFATALLMPANQFKPAFVRLEGDQSALSRLFLVTEKAVKRRVAELSLD